MFDLSEAHEPEAILLATGSEVEIIMDAQKLLAEQGVAARVVSMPCWERFNQCSVEYKNTLIPRQAKTVVMEAGTSFGWSGMINADPHQSYLLSVDTFGTSAPLKDLQQKFGFTAELATEKIGGWLAGFSS